MTHQVIDGCDYFANFLTKIPVEFSVENARNVDFK